MKIRTNGELLISEICGGLSEISSINYEEVKIKLSEIISNYHVMKLENEEVHPDLLEHIQLFLSAKKLEGLSANTLGAYKLELRIFSDHIKKKVENITSAEIRVYLGQFDYLKMSSLAKKLSVLKSFFGWLTNEEILQRDPTAKLKPPKEVKRLPKALTIEELEMLREACKTTRQRAFIEVLYASGARLSEVYQLNIFNINQQSMSSHVIGKGNKEREVYLSFKALYHLNKYLESRSDDCEALFVTERKPYRRLSRRGIQREIKKIGELAGFADKVHPHVLRHTFATLTLNNGAELVAIQELLGHSSSETTLRYARITEERKREQHKKFLVQ